LEPVTYDEGIKNTDKLIIDNNGISTKHSLIALGTEISSNESLIWHFSYRLELNTSENNVLNSICGIELTVPEQILHYDRKEFIKSHSLDSDNYTIFDADDLYEITLVFFEFEYILLQDTISAVISIPDMVTTDGEILIEAQKIEFSGLIQRD
jgi:hypothetical protein